MQQLRSINLHDVAEILYPVKLCASVSQAQYFQINTGRVEQNLRLPLVRDSPNPGLDRLKTSEVLLNGIGDLFRRNQHCLRIILQMKTDRLGMEVVQIGDMMSASRRTRRWS